MIDIDIIKERIGIPSGTDVYDEEIESYIDDCVEDMRASGVSEEILDAALPSVLTAATFYVRAHWGNDRSDTELYLKLYREKVFRLSLEGE